MQANYLSLQTVFLQENLSLQIKENYFLIDDHAENQTIEKICSLIAFAKLCPLFSPRKIEGKDAFSVVPYRLPDAFFEQIPLTPKAVSFSPFCARRLILLPTDPKYQSFWKKLGIDWTKDLDESPSFALAYLPLGWTFNVLSTSSALISYRILDDQDAPCFEADLKFEGEKLDSEVRFFKAEAPFFKPLSSFSLYCSYSAVCQSISSWGKTRLVMQRNDGTENLFVVKFNQPVKFASITEGVLVNSSTFPGIFSTPFSLKGIPCKEKGVNAVILSRNMIAFQIKCLKKDFFSASLLWEASAFVQDIRFKIIAEEAKKYSTLKGKRILNAIEEIFTEQDKPRILLEWIKNSGERILEKGLHLLPGQTLLIEPSLEEIASHYQKASPSWKKVDWK